MRAQDQIPLPHSRPRDCKSALSQATSAFACGVAHPMLRVARPAIVAGKRPSDASDAVSYSKTQQHSK